MRPARAALPALGCMRLSTDPARNDEHAVALLHAAFDAGVELLDTADAYCSNHHDVGHNERLIARALATWTGDASRVVVATKGGLTRPDGNWVPDGRARHLLSACEASRRALGVERISLYQLHVVDPRVPLATSVRALAALQRDGCIERIGLCNVHLAQIEEARRHADIAAVQVELSVRQDAALVNGVAEYCAANHIQLLAYRPVGGSARARQARTDPALAESAARHGVTPQAIALAWLRDLSDVIVPLPGPTRLETVRSIVAAHQIVLRDDDRARLDRRVPSGGVFRARGDARPPSAAMRRDGEVVLVMGLPGAGKSTVARELVSQGYARVNRDEAGGSLSGLLGEIDRLVADGSTRIVADNTYVSRQARARLVGTAQRHGLPVRCVWASTSVEDAQVNVCWRMVSRYGRLLSPEEMKQAAKQDPGVVGPGVLFRYHRELEPPVNAEGFSQIEAVPFVRRMDPAHGQRAVIVWCDGILCRSRAGLRTPASVEDLEVDAVRAGVLQRYRAEGWRVLGLSWQPEIEEGARAAADVEALFARMQALLGVAIDVAYCPHAAGPPTCWCRKPLPGLGVELMHRYQLDPAQCVYVGAGPQDPGFARRLGFAYRDAESFFATMSVTRN